MDEDKNLELSAYVKRGVMLILRAALPDSDPESWPSKWKERFGTDLNQEIPDWRDSFEAQEGFTQ